MSSSKGIHHRLLSVVLLGVLTSVLSLTALVRLFSTSTSQRLERARDAVQEELARRVRVGEANDSTATLIGMRGGVWDGAGSPAALPEAWREPVHVMILQSAARRQRVLRDFSLPGGTLVVAAEPAPKASAWSAHLVRPAPSFVIWCWIVGLLSLATALLFATAVYAIVTLNRGAAALHSSLQALATDLSAPVARPRVRELSDIAEQIAALARRLAKARAEEERLEHELAEQERLAALGRVVAGVAHEVRNPLASIKLRLDLVAAGKTLPETAERALNHASSEIERLDRLVADLLLVAGRAIGPKIVTSLGELLRLRIEALLPWAESMGRQVTFSVSGDGAAAIDSDAVARAIDNLLRNAVEASAAGGRVTAYVSRHAERVKIRIEDSGAGVKKEREAQLFEPFFTTKSDGTGLGLAISRSIARAHGGDVIYLREGGVTCFELSLVQPRPIHVEAAA